MGEKMKKLVPFLFLVIHIKSVGAFEYEPGFTYKQEVDESSLIKITKKEKYKIKFLKFEPKFEPIHQKMTIESLKLGQLSVGDASAACKTTNAQWNDYFTEPSGAAVSIRMCCPRGYDPKSNRMCEKLMRDNGSAIFDALEPDEAPIITGSVWPDDPCHLIARKKTNLTFGTWMGIGPYTGNNLFYQSHFHDYQFMHSMAPSTSHPRRTGGPEDAKTTRHKIKVWAEFAFKVSDGTIYTNMKLSDAVVFLSENARDTFSLVFSPYANTTVAKFFTGWNEAPPEQVRQIAAGSLLHTVQDSFSDAHADRKKSNDKSIRQFSDFKTQISTLHKFADKVCEYQNNNECGGKADNEMLQPQRLDAYHPISKGAQLLSCIVAGAADQKSRWEQYAENIVTDVFIRPDSWKNPKVPYKPNLRASPRSYAPSRRTP
jgi:hypothetical protein